MQSDRKHNELENPALADYSPRMSSFLLVITAGLFGVGGTLLGAMLTGYREGDKVKRDLLIKASADFEQAYSIILKECGHRLHLLRARRARESERIQFAIKETSDHQKEVSRAIDLISRLRGNISLAGSSSLISTHDKIAEKIPHSKVELISGELDQLDQELKNEIENWSKNGDLFRAALKSDFDQIGRIDGSILDSFVNRVRRLGE